MTRFSRTLLALGLLGVWACSDDHQPKKDFDAGVPDAVPDTSADLSMTDVLCDPGLKPHGSACIPVLDSCKRDEVPVPGGGCKKVGVAPCAGGIQDPASSTCTPVGVEECPGGLKGPTETTCTLIGPPATCLTGWAKTSGGWCEPILPAASCPAGTMEVLGQATCQPIGDCGTGTWGKIPVTASTIFVDQAYAGGGSDGTQAKPFTTLTAALAAAPSNAQIAVAAGTYAEDLSLDKPVTIQGRCAQQVTVQGQQDSTNDDFAPAVEVQAQVKLTGLTVTGPNVGIRVKTGEATLERVVVSGCGYLGVFALAGTKVSLDHSLVQGNHGVGLYAKGSNATLDHTMVRETQPRALDKLLGTGVQAVFDEDSATPAKVTVRDCLIAGNRNNAIAVVGGDATIERTVMRDTLPQASDGLYGYGILGGLGLPNEPPSTVTVKDCVIADNHHTSVLFQGAKGTLERTVVRGTKPQLANSTYGSGIVAKAVGDHKKVQADLTVRDCLVLGNRFAAIWVEESKALIERTVVRDTEAQASDKLNGFGVGARDAQLTVKDCLVAGNRQSGIVLEGAEGTVQGTVIRDTRPQVSDKGNGYGIQVLRYNGKISELTVQDTLVASNRDVGVNIVGSKGTIERTVVRDTLPRTADNTRGHAIQASRIDGQSSTLTMTDCLVTNNRDHAIGLFGSTATLERTIVRDTQPRDSDQQSGVGVSSRSWDGEPATLTIRDSLVSNNRSMGVRLCATDAILERTVVRDTLPWAEDGSFGYGLAVKKLDDRSSTLSMTDCVVDNNRTLGIGLYSSDATLTRTVIRDTLPKAMDGSYGAAIHAGPWIDSTGAWDKTPSTLKLSDCLVSGSRTMGLAVATSSATIQRSIVRDTRTSTTDEYGDGIQVSSLEEGRSVELYLVDSLVEGSARAGLIFYGTKGSVRRSVFRQGVFSIVLEKKAAPEIGDDNVFEKNELDPVSNDKGLKPAPPPEVPPT